MMKKQIEEIREKANLETKEEGNQEDGPIQPTETI